MVSASAAAIKWLEQLLAQEKELDSREGAITTWEDGLVAFACALGDARMECDAKHVQAVAVQQYFLARTRASCSRSKQLHHLSRTLE
jgi:hypothetical protein